MAVLAVGLGLTGLGLPGAWLVWPLGYGVALPLALAYERRAGRTGEPGAGGEPDGVKRAKEAYVTGEIDEPEFERRLEAALEEA
jgi:uncharacterized membrane protein